MLTRRHNSMLDVFTDFLDVNKSLYWSGVEDPVSISTDEDACDFYIRVVAPGFTEDEMLVNVTGRQISISGKKEVTTNKIIDRFSSSKVGFEHSFTLPPNTIVEDISAELKNGILVVSIPKKPSPAVEKSRTVPIKSLTEGTE